jgi:hypothetical protein
LWARRERREKRAERVAGHKNLIFSLGMPSGQGALPRPRELRVLSNVSRVIMSARVREGTNRHRKVLGTYRLHDEKSPSESRNQSEITRFSALGREVTPS